MKKKRRIKLGVSGACGRMGRRILALAVRDRSFRLALALEHPAHPLIQDSVEGLRVWSDPERIQEVDVLIDFSSIEATLAHLQYAVKFRKPIVIGTTGFSEGQKRKVRRAAGKTCVVFSPNMSIGVNLLFRLVQEAASRLPREYEVSIREAHHVHKKDSPSGTAKFLKEIVLNERSWEKVPVAAIRQGEIVGDHELTFESGVDILKLSHSAKTRDIFAKGALTAAKFAVTKKSGFYSMQQVLDSLKK